MVPIEKGLKLADGKISGEKSIFKKTKDGFGAINPSLSTYGRKFTLNFENDKVRRAGVEKNK